MDIQRFVTLTEASSSEGELYKDSRADYVGKSGLLKVAENDDANQGAVRAVFFIANPDHSVSKIVTSKGVCTENNERIIIRTAHSTYVFNKEFDITKDDELVLTEAGLDTSSIL